MDKRTHKTSVILIAKGNTTKVFRSVDEVPPDLRKKLLQSTSGANSATVLIADEGGRREILRSIQRESPDLQTRPAGSAGSPGRGFLKKWPLGSRQWIEIGLLGGIGLCLWLLAAWK